MPALSYRDVLDRYDRARAFGEQRDLPTYAADLNDMYDTQDFSAGLQDGWWKRASTRADQNFFEPIGHATTEPLLGAVGGMFGAEDTGRKVGLGLPRTLADTLPLFIPGVDVAYGGALAAGATGGLMAAHTYADTGSARSAAISGVTGAAMPFLAHVGGALGLRLAGAPLARGLLTDTGEAAGLGKAGDFFSQRLATTAPEFLSQYAGSQGALAAGQLASAKYENPDEDVFSKDFATQFLLGQIPFTALDVVHGARTLAHGLPTREQVGSFTTPDVVKPLVESKPLEPRQGSPEEYAKLDEIAAAYEKIANDPLADSATKSEALANLTKAIQTPAEVPLPISLSDVIVQGYTNGRNRILVDSYSGDQSKVPEHKTMVFYPDQVKDLQHFGNGEVAFRIPEDKINPAKYSLERPFVDPNQSELPPQPKPVEKVPYEQQLPKPSIAQGAQTAETAYGRETSVHDAFRDIRKSQPFTPEEKQTAIQMGAKPEALVETTSVIHPPIKEAVHRYEMAKQREVEARAKVAKAPQTAEEWAEDVEPEEVKKLVDEGLSPTQALGQAKLVHAAKEVDEALTDQAIAKEVVKQKAGDQYIGKEQNQYAKEAVKDENGRRLNFKNESEALQHRETVAASEGRDPEDWTVRNNGRGEYYLVEKLNRKVSLDIEDSGGHERVASQAEQDTEEQSRDVREEVAPEVDDATAAEGLQDRLTRLMSLDPADLPTDLQPYLQSAKDFIQKKGAGEEVSAEEQAAFDKLKRRYLGLRNYSLDSQLPHDEALVQEMGLREKGPVAWLDWYVKNAPNPADIQTILIRELADAVRNSANALKITRNYEDGWAYTPTENGAPSELNIPVLPIDREHALRVAPSMAHELAHHLTSELESRGDPAAKAFHKVLLDMQKVLEKSPLLPKKVQMAIDAAKEQGLYEKFRSYNVDLVDWFNNFVGKKNKQWLPVFYGLLHPQEMIAQTFGSRDFVGLLAGTKRTAPSGVRERVLDWFSRAWHTLAGLKAGTENMLGQMLEHFDDYLGKGSGYTGMDFIRDRLVSQGVRPEGLVSRVQTIRDLLKTGDPATSSKGWDRENGAGTLPVTAEYTPNLLDLSRTPGQLTKDILGMDPALVAGHGDRIVRMAQDVHLAQLTAKKIQSGEIPDRVEEGVSGKLAAAAAQVNAMRKAMARYGREQQRFEATRNLDGHSFRNSIEGRMRNAVQPSPSDPPANMDLARELLGLATPMVPVETAADVRARTADEMLKRTKLQQATRAVEFNVLLQPHLTRIHPAHAARNDVLQREESNAHDRNSMLQLAYNWSDKVKGIDHKVLDNNVRVKNTEHLANTASAIRLVANEIVKRGEVANWDHPEIQAVAKHLGPENREAVKTEYESAKRRYDMSNNGTWPRFYDDVIPLELAQTIAARDQVLPDSARQVAGDFYQTLKELKDPQAAPLAVEKLRALMTKLSPDTVLKVIAQGNAAMQSAEDHIAFLKSRSHYTSEQRYGKYHVTMLSADGKPIRLDGNTLQEVAAKRDAKEKQGARLLGVMPREDANAATGTSQEVLNKLEELEGQRQQRQAAALDGMDPLTKQQLLDPAGLAQDVRTSLAAMQPLPGVARKFREGRESLNMLENDDQFYLRQNNYMRHKLTRAGDQLERLHPEIAGNLELKKYGDQMLEAFLTPDNPLARRLTSLVFFNKLAFEFGNTVLESMQHLTTGMQQLISETGTVGDAFALTQNASKAFWKHAFTGKWANEDQEWLVKQMKATGHDIQSSWNDIHDPNVIALRTANSGKSLAGRAVGAIDNLSKSFSQKAQGYGNYIGMLSAFEHGRAQGMSRDEAFQYAASSKNQGMYTGGKGQRPGLWRIKTKAIPQIMSSLQTYALGWFGQMYTDYVRGFSKNRPQGLTRTQIEGSKKAFLYGLAVQATLAGALGLPGVGQGLALMQQATGVDMKGWVRAHMQDLFDEDQAGGGGITALAMNGLLAGATPFDPSGRASIGLPFTGVDSYQGFSVANLAGAPGATLQDYVKGLTAVAGGDRTGWEKLLPNFLKRPARLAMDDGDVKDARGDLLYQMSPQERAMTLMGLPPSRIQRARDVAEAAKNASKAAIAKQEGLTDSLAKMFDTEGPQTVQQKLVELGQTQPELDLRQLVKQIGERRQRQQTPFDWRREVNPASELQGLNVYNPSTVAQGQAIQQQTEQALGLRTPANPRADMEAMTIDALVNSGAAKTQAEARKMLSHKRPERPLQFPGS